MVPSAKRDLLSTLPKMHISHTSTNDNGSSISTQALNSEPGFPKNQCAPCILGHLFCLLFTF